MLKKICQNMEQKTLQCIGNEQRSYFIIYISITTNYDVIIFTIVVHPHLKALGDQEEEKWKYGELFSQSRQLCKVGKQEKVWKCITYLTLHLIIVM